MIDNQMFLQQQMEGLRYMKKQSAHSKSPVRGTMNAIELMYNKDILMEISAAKKLKQV